MPGKNSEQITKGAYMNHNTVYAKIILFENSIFASIAASKKMLSACSERCRNSIKNGPNSNFQVQCCTSSCKIKAYTKLIAALQALKGNIANEGSLNKKIMYFSSQLQLERSKYMKYRTQLKKRQTTVPVSMSSKPSPERWNPRSLN